LIFAQFNFIQNRLKKINPNEFVPGIKSYESYDHTVHLIESDRETILNWRDLTHAMAIQIPFPEVAITYDSDSVLAVQARKQVFE
jgi:hypothetical protein